MTDEEYKKGYEEYKEWEKTRKEMCVDFNDIHPFAVCEGAQPGWVSLAIRNGDQPLHVGDWMGGKQIVRLDAYGKSLNEFGQGMTGWVTLDGMPGYMVQETYPEMVEWIKKVRNDRTRIP